MQDELRNAMMSEGESTPDTTQEVVSKSNSISPQDKKALDGIKAIFLDFETKALSGTPVAVMIPALINSLQNLGGVDASQRLSESEGTEEEEDM